MFIKVSMDATLFGVVLNTSFISALQQKEARIGFKILNELTVFLETWIKDSSEDSQTDFSPKENQMLYNLVVFLHVLFVFGYLLAHGVSASVSYAIKKERDVNRIRALLDLSAASYPAMLWTLLAIFVFGLAAAFLNMVWWKFGWIWVSIVVLVVIVVLMAIYGAGVFGEIRKAVGLPYMVKGKPFPAEPAKSDEEVFAVVSKVNPALLLVIGYGGFAVIAWLMTAKPF